MDGPEGARPDVTTWLARDSAWIARTGLLLVPAVAAGLALVVFTLVAEELQPSTYLLTVAFVVLVNGASLALVITRVVGRCRAVGGDR